MVEPYSVPNPWDGVTQGYKLGNALRMDALSQKAGQAMAGGDLSAGANALLTGGDIEGGLQVQSYLGQRQDAAARSKKDADAEALKYTMDVAGRLADLHNRTGDVNRTLDAFDQAAPGLQRYANETPEDIARIREAIAKDPQGTFAALGAAAKKYQLANGGEGYLGAFDPDTGTLKELRGARPKPLEMDPAKNYYLPDPEGGSADEVPLSAGAPPPPPAAHAAGAPSADQVWQSIKTQESGGEAHPGSAVGPDTPYGNAQGSTQMLPATAEAMARKLGIRWDPRLMREDTPQALAYQDKLGRAYFDEGLQKSGGDLAAGAAYYYGGPDPALHGPKTRAYVQQVLARAGAAPQLAGGDGSDTVATPQIPGYHLVQTAKPKSDVQWVSDGKGNLINQKTGDRKVDPTAEVAPDPKLDGLTGPDLLKAAGADAGTIKALAEGRLQFPSGMALSKPYWQKMLQMVAQYDPTFDAANPNSRVATRRDFTSGKSAQNITALNTVIGHLDHLDRTIDALGNFGSEIGPLSRVNNAAAHWLAKQSGTDARVRDFETAKSAVANELTRVFRGSGGAEADIQDWQKKLDGAASPEALKTVVRSMATLINSRIQALGEQYAQGMGVSQDPIRLLTPDKQKAFQRMIGSGSGAPGSSATAASDPISQARDAIRRGAPRDAVIQRLRAHGIDPAGL